ncbi:NAD(P)H-flavin reductase [Idiomarina xiamenensis]|uniref:FMN reductase n=1 Tax=Idiomarina xiamenensis 10-D-4 TaxID=740709 RepID=K2K9K7_9GAMM|nr:NAD(P)H-flavin reductase [Idiomarina xiamenensis]EKE84483.1 FMN reductase [Idiomarina xiamenensis 10-D-4]
MKQLSCQASIRAKLTDSVYEVALDLPEPLPFAAGQYLQVVMGERDKRPFSIASCPSQPQQLLLHIGASDDNPYAMEVIAAIQQQQQLSIEVPLGDAHYRADSARPLLLLAGGTGFSYVWSILQAHLASGNGRPVTLYWGGRSANDLYLHKQLKRLADEYEQFDYRPVVENAEADWRGAIGLVHHAAIAEQPQLAEHDVYVAGRFEMVRVVRDDFVAKGLPLANLYGDALAFI